METETLAPDRLKPHQYNIRLFRQDADAISERFVEDVAEQMEEPIVVNEEYEIIDGTRRWLAAREAELDSVHIVRRAYDNVEAEKLAILRHNDDRDESYSQKMRVALEYEEAIAPLLQERMKAGVKPAERDDDPLLDLAEGNVTARDLASKRINWSGSKYNQAKQVWKAAYGRDNVAQPIQRRAKELIREIENPEENTSVYSAYQTLKREKERQELRDPVDWKTIQEAGVGEDFDKVDEAFDATRDSLDRSKDWPILLESLSEEYARMWDQSPDEGDSHVLVYLLDDKGMVDLDQDSSMSAGSIVERKPDRETLESLYWEDDMSLTQIAIRYGVREEVVKYWLREEDIYLKQREFDESIQRRLNEFR